MKFKRINLTKKHSFFFFKNEIMQLHIKLLINILWFKNINFIFLNRFLFNSTIFFKDHLKMFCIESGRSQSVKKKF